MGRLLLLGSTTAELTERYEQGESLHDLAAAYDVSVTAVRNALLKAGVRMRLRGPALHPRGPSLRGPANPNWTGDKATYNGRHLRVRAARGQATGPCAHCDTMDTTSRFEWAQLHGMSGLLPEHYVSLCRLCHEDYDAAIVSAEEAEEIRALHFFGVKQKRLAMMYGTNDSYISLICSGKRRARQKGCEL